MKKHIKGCLYIFVMMCLLTPAFSSNASGFSQLPDKPDTGTFRPYADVIVTKFRIHNGDVQCRRWNETQNCWVDPGWINVTDL